MLSVEKEIGERLRKAREAMGLSLAQLQEETKIQKSFLEAIENGEFSKLPSPFYVRTYLRAYCKCVKIEPHHILRQYRKAEQAERGLTSVQPAITPEMQAQLQQQQQQQQHGVQGNVHMIHHNGRVLGQNTLSPTVGRNQTTRRTNMNTALTIAKKSNLPNQQYSQRTHQVEASRLQNETILKPRNDLKHTPAKNYDVTKTSRRVSSHIEHVKKKAREFASRKVLNSSKYSTKKNRLLGSGKRDQTLQSTANRSEQNPSRSYHNQNRFATNHANQPRDLHSKSTSPSLYERRKRKEDLSREVTKMPKLSRSSIRRSRRSSRSGSFDWADQKTKRMLIIAACVIVFIPLVLATVNAFSTDDKKKEKEAPMMKNDQSKQQEETSMNEATQDQEKTEDQIVLTKSTPEMNTYEVSGTNQLNLRFRAQGESWIQVRKQPNPQKHGYLDEATLQSGHEDTYSHNFANGKEIWISLGIPEYVVVTLNGKKLKSSKTIHIKQK